jgi:hypothetical protein
MSPARGIAFPVYVEQGSKRVFAGALDWPGWCRGARDEAGALEALAASAPRYARALRGTRLGFHPPREPAFHVVERLPGGAGTDFGAPGEVPTADAAPLDEADLRRLLAVLRACWRTFDAIAAGAEGVTLATGPRGGGRPLSKIVDHVLESDGAYLRALGWKPPRDGSDPVALRDAVAAGLAASARGEIPARGPRGGVRWTARYLVRRSAWHVLDHAWEIEDRSA